MKEPDILVSRMSASAGPTRSPPPAAPSRGHQSGRRERCRSVQLLVLDEPTNNLDLQSVDRLVEALTLDREGALLPG